MSKKYTVEVTDVVVYRYEVEAESEEAAKEQAIEGHIQSDNMDDFFDRVEERTAEIVSE